MTEAESHPLFEDLLEAARDYSRQRKADDAVNAALDLHPEIPLEERQSLGRQLMEDLVDED